MQQRWITDIEEFRKIAEDWDNGLLSSGEENPFLLSDFILTRWKYYHKNRKLLVFSVVKDGRITAGIPLCLSRRGTVNFLEHVGGCAANITQGFSADKKFDFTGSFLDGLSKNTDWDVFVLDRVLPGGGPLMEVLQKTPQLPKNIKCRISPAGFNGIIDLREGFQHVIAALPKRLKRYLEKGKREAGLIGGLKLIRASGTDEVRALYQEFKKLSIDSFRLRNAQSAFNDLAHSSFFAELMETFARKSMLDTHKLIAGDKTLGISFAYHFGRSFKWILTAFNPEFHKLRPGHLLIEALVREAADRSAPYFDMYYGGELFYKQQWCNKMVPLKRIELYRGTLKNNACVWARGLVRSNKILLNAARGVKKAAQDFHLRNGLTGGRGKLLVLSYHRVLPEVGFNPFKTIISLEAFKRQLEFLCNNFSVISLSEALRQAESRQIEGRVQVALTFDDGYVDSYEVIYPILKNKGLSAAFFLVPEYIGKNTPLWDWELTNVLYYNGGIDRVLLRDKIIYDKGMPGRLSFIFAVLEKMKSLSAPQRQEVLHQLRKQVKQEVGLQEKCMSWEQAKEMSSAGMEIGCHGLSHSSLARIPSAEATEEIRAAKEAIEKNISKSCLHFAFPFGSRGDFNLKLIDCVKKSGFKSCLLNIHGVNDLKESPCCFKRIIMDDSAVYSLPEGA